MTSGVLVGVAGIVLSLTVGIAVQETFEVASVKRSGNVDSVVPGVFLPNGQWSARGATLAMLVRSAYDLDRFVGMPAWAYSDRFDVVTTGVRDTPLAQLQAMARKLLADRFELRARLERRNSEVQALVRTKASGPLGPGLRPSAATCPRGSTSTDVPLDTTRVNQCTESVKLLAGGARLFQLRDRPLNDLLILSGARSEIGGVIVDQTALVGRFDIDLEFEPRTSREQNPSGLGVPFIVAFERQLGLRFEQRQELLDVLIIEHVAMPSVD